MADGYSQADAKHMLPPGTALRKDTTENRYRVPKNSFSIGYSKSYGSGTGLNDFQAMTQVLALAWQDCRRAHAVDCPCEFEELALP